MNKSCISKQSQLLIILLMFLSPTLCGCVPAYYTYWSPSARGGKLISSTSPTSIAPYNTIEFSFNGVRIQITGGGDWTGFALLNSEGRSVSFISNEAEFPDEELSDRKILKFDVSALDTVSLERKHFSPTDVLTGDLYVADIILGGEERAQWRFRLPAIKIDDQLYEIPEIVFTRKKGFGVFGP